MALKQRGIRAEYLSSAQTNSSVYSNAERGQYDVLYMTPEKACMLISRCISNNNVMKFCERLVFFFTFLLYQLASLACSLSLYVSGFWIFMKFSAPNTMQHTLFYSCFYLAL